MSDAPAGWYPDPKMAGTQRYWDGEQWTEHVAPMPEDRPSEGVLVAGWVTALLIPVVGLIIGLTQLNRNRQGWRIMVVSICSAVIWFTVLRNLQTL
jgi:hypothetical protein